MKSYKIRTTTDIYKAVTSENVDGFLKDFETFVRSSLVAKESLHPFALDIAEAGFTWNDDGDYGTLKSVKVELKNKPADIQHDHVFIGNTPPDNEPYCSLCGHIESSSTSEGCPNGYPGENMKCCRCVKPVPPISEDGKYIQANFTKGNKPSSQYSVTKTKENVVIEEEQQEEWEEGFDRKWKDWYVRHNIALEMSMIKEGIRLIILSEKAKEKKETAKEILGMIEGIIDFRQEGWALKNKIKDKFGIEDWQGGRSQV